MWPPFRPVAPEQKSLASSRRSRGFGRASEPSVHALLSSRIERATDIPDMPEPMMTMSAVGGNNEDCLVASDGSQSLSQNGVVVPWEMGTPGSESARSSARCRWGAGTPGSESFA